MHHYDLRAPVRACIHISTHTHIYIYIYVYRGTWTSHELVRGIDKKSPAHSAGFGTMGRMSERGFGIEFRET